MTRGARPHEAERFTTGQAQGLAFGFGPLAVSTVSIVATTSALTKKSVVAVLVTFDEYVHQRSPTTMSARQGTPHPIVVEVGSSERARTAGTARRHHF